MQKHSTTLKLTASQQNWSSCELTGKPKARAATLAKVTGAMSGKTALHLGKWQVDCKINMNLCSSLGYS